MEIIYDRVQGEAVAEWLSSWLAEQEDRGSIPGLATWIFRDWLFPASKSRYGWKIAKSTLIPQNNNQPTAYKKGYIENKTDILTQMTEKSSWVHLVNVLTISQ